MCSQFFFGPWGNPWTGVPGNNPTAKKDDEDEGGFEIEETTQEIPQIDIDFMNEFEKEMEEELKKCKRQSCTFPSDRECECKKGNPYCSCGDKEPVKNWADGKEFFVCRKCKKEIVQ